MLAHPAGDGGKAAGYWFFLRALCVLRGEMQFLGLTT